MNYNSRCSTRSVYSGFSNSLLSLLKSLNKFLVMFACKLGVKLARKMLSYFWKCILSSEEEMKD